MNVPSSTKKVLKKKKKSSSSSLKNGLSLSPSSIASPNGKSSSKKKKSKSLSNVVESNGDSLKKKKKSLTSSSTKKTKSRSSSSLNGEKSHESQRLNTKDDTTTTTTPSLSEKRRIIQRGSPPSMPLHELPDPNEMINTIHKEMKTLKVEAKHLFEEMETTKKETGTVMKQLLEVKRKAQLEKLKGNELVKIEQLLQMGFDENVLKYYFVSVNEEMNRRYMIKAKDIKNLESNIAKMVSANKESEKAVIAAHGAVGPLITRQQMLQMKLEQAELELYTMETKAEHRRNMKEVEIASTDKFKTTLKHILHKLQQRSKDQHLLQDVLKKASKTFQVDVAKIWADDDGDDLVLDDDFKSESSGDDDNSISGNEKVQTKNGNGDNNGNQKIVDTEDDDSGDDDSSKISNVSSSSSDLSSVEVSSVEDG